MAALKSIQQHLAHHQRVKMNENSKAILLLTSNFDTKRAALNSIEYSDFANVIYKNSYSPKDLFSSKKNEILALFDSYFSDRIERLLKDGNAMALYLDKLNNFGIKLITRAEKYPKNLKKNPNLAVPFIHYVGNIKSLLEPKNIGIYINRNDLNIFSQCDIIIVKEIFKITGFNEFKSFIDNRGLVLGINLPKEKLSKIADVLMAK